MKRWCKKVDVSDPDFIRGAVLACLEKPAKRRRIDCVCYFADMARLETLNEARRMLEERTEDYSATVDIIARQLSAEIKARRIMLPRPATKTRRDPSSGKVRKIALLHIKQLLLDHVAVFGMAELMKRLGFYQCSGIEGKGAHFGARTIRRWCAEPRARYAVKMDIRNYYGSVNHDLLFSWLEQHIKNEELLWLIRRLVSCVPEGLAIGSYLSQTLGNLYMAELYHLAEELPEVRHVLFYMDDMLIMGANKRKLLRAAEAIADTAHSMGLQLKYELRVIDIRKQPIDMLGWRFWWRRTSIRRKLFRRMRRALLRVCAAAAVSPFFSLSLAKRAVSYKGYLDFLRAPSALRCAFGLAAKRIQLQARYD